MELKFKHFVILQYLDVLTTWYGLTYLHLAEANPLANYAFNEYGLIQVLVIMKIVSLIVVFGAIKSYELICQHTHIKINPLKIKKLVFNISCIIVIVVVINNSYQMIRVI